MHITQIEVSDLNTAKGEARGFVSFHCDQGNVQMHCSIPKEGLKNPRLALISEALRQLARMPEYRTGRRTFSFGTSIRDADPMLA
ncbi:MAG: hypothetical protein VX201_03945 [Pseudomonadota bacterium]|jgi:hypothetical protein|nr:hypothetical protein [Pseudomonadota bacterium]